MIILSGLLGLLLLLMLSTFLTLGIGLTFDLVDQAGYFHPYLFPASFCFCLLVTGFMIYRSERRK